MWLVGNHIKHIRDLGDLAAEVAVTLETRCELGNDELLGTKSEVLRGKGDSRRWWNDVEMRMTLA